MLAAALAVFAGTAFAANPACESPADEKKSFGAAKRSLVTYCAKDAIGVAAAR
jgi:hypothetical protein